MSRMKSLGAGVAGSVFSTVITRQIAELADARQRRNFNRPSFVRLWAAMSATYPPKPWRRVRAPVPHHPPAGWTNVFAARYAEAMKIYLDGKFVDAADAKVSVFDHGLLYGDGVFEGIRLYGGNVFRLDEHLERFEYSAKAILLDLPLTRAEWSAAVCETCRQNGLVDGYIRLVVTRGVGDLGLSPWLCPKPTIFIIADKIALYPKEYYEKGLEIVTVPTRRISPAALPSTVKSLNYLNNIMGKMEARQAGALEGIMLNEQGYVAECTGDNIFIVHQGAILTPAASQGALK